MTGLHIMGHELPECNRGKNCRSATDTGLGAICIRDKNKTGSIRGIICVMYVV